MKKINIPLDSAISELAALFEDGELQACTDPTSFIYRVRDEIVRLREITLPYPRKSGSIELR